MNITTIVTKLAITLFCIGFLLGGIGVILACFSESSEQLQRQKSNATAVCLSLGVTLMIMGIGLKYFSV